MEVRTTTDAMTNGSGNTPIKINTNTNKFIIMTTITMLSRHLVITCDIEIKIVSRRAIMMGVLIIMNHGQLIIINGDFNNMIYKTCCQTIQL